MVVAHRNGCSKWQMLATYANSKLQYFRVFGVRADRQAAAAAAAALIFSYHLCGCCWSAYMAIVETNKNGIFFFRRDLSIYALCIRGCYTPFLFHFIRLFFIFSSLPMLRGFVFYFFHSVCSIPGPALCHRAIWCVCARQNVFSLRQSEIQIYIQYYKRTY